MKGNIKNIEIAGIQAAVPCNEVDNMQYISQLSNHRIKKQIELTGIKKRRVTLEKQKASDLATEAAKKLMKTLKWKETEVEVLIFVTQSPDLQRERGSGRILRRRPPALGAPGNLHEIGQSIAKTLQREVLQQLFRRRRRLFGNKPRHRRDMSDDGSRTSEPGQQLV